MRCPTLSDLPKPPKGQTGWPWTKKTEQLPDKLPDGSDWPKISIVTPNYNYGHFIEETIRSVLLQGYPNLEYIIINGESTDNSLKIIKKYEPWINYWITEPDNGVSQAINKGFEKATGEIYNWINSDDIYCPWAFKTVASIMTELPQVKWVTTLNPGVWYSDGFCAGFGNMKGYSREAFLDGYYLPDEINKRTFGWIQQESTFWTRDLWEKVGSCVNNNLHLAGDFDLWSRFYAFEELYGSVSPLSGYREHQHRKMRCFDIYFIEARNPLLNLQKELKWKKSIMRDLLLKFRFNELPLFKRVIKYFLGYKGYKIIKNERNKWEIFPYKFHFD